MGLKETYEYIHDNPAVVFKPVSYTNNPLVISRNRNMTAINSALEIDITGQATADSIGDYFYSGIGGQADFMRGAVLADKGKTILAIESTAEGGSVSRIVPFLREGAGVTITRGDVHYVVTEQGITYLYGKNLRERAMGLIAIAHPHFRRTLIEEAKKRHIIYRDQVFIPGRGGEYPEHLEAYRTTERGLRIFLRPVKITDEQLLKDFFYSLSADCMFNRFMSSRKDMHHDRLQKFVIIDYTKEMVILAVLEAKGREKIIGKELLLHLTYIAKKNGLHGFAAEVLKENQKMLRLFGGIGFNIQKTMEAGTYELRLSFRG